MSRRGSQSPVRNSTPVNFVNGISGINGQYQNNMRQSFSNMPVRNSFAGLSGTQIRQSTVPAQNVNSRYVYQNNQPQVVEAVGRSYMPQQSFVQQPSVVQREVIYQQEPEYQYVQQEPEYIEKIVQVKGPSQIQYIDQPPQIVEKIIQVQEPPQVREIIKEVFVPQIQIEEKIVEIEKPYEVIQWKDVPGEIEVQIKHVEKPMEVISYQEGEPRYIEEVVEIPIHTTKPVIHEVEVYHEQVVEEIDRSQIDRLNSDIEELKLKCEKQNIDWRIAVDDDHSAIVRHPDTDFAMQKSAAMYQNVTSSQQAVKSKPYRQEAAVKGGYNRNKVQPTNSRLNYDDNYGQRSQYNDNYGQRSQQNDNYGQRSQQNYYYQDHQANYNQQNYNQSNINHSNQHQGNQQPGNLSNRNRNQQNHNQNDNFAEDQYHEMLNQFGISGNQVQSLNRVDDRNTNALDKNTKARSSRQMNNFQSSNMGVSKREY